MRRFLATIAAFFLLLPSMMGQTPIEDRPQIIDKKLLSREELEKQEGELLRRQAKTLFGLGVMHERAERVLDALKLFEEAQKLDPESIAIRRGLIPIYLSLGRDIEALEGCKKVLESDSGDYEVAFKQATIYKLLGKKPETVAALRLSLASNRISERPDKQLLILLQLCGQLNQMGDSREEAKELKILLALIANKRTELINSVEFTASELVQYTVEGYEKLGKCHLQSKEADLALTAYQKALAILTEQGDAITQAQGNRINWYLCEICTSQEKWTEALRYLESYLEQHPGSLEPYERKILLLRNLNREIIPVVRKLAQEEPHHIGIQLLLARELSRDGRTQAEAEKLYKELTNSYTKPDIYRGLFKLYLSTERMDQVLILLDETFAASSDKEKEAESREAAGDRWRAMMIVLREEKEIVKGLLNAASLELRNFQFNRKRKLATWQFLASLAANTRQLDKAEAIFRHCLEQAAPFQKDDIYEGLLDVLRLSHQWLEVKTLCKQLLKRPDNNKMGTEAQFHEYLAIALGELGEFEESLVEFDQAYKMAPDDGWKIRLRESKARMLSHAGKDALAIVECEKMLKDFKLPSEQRSVRTLLATIYDSAREHEKSEQQLRMVLENEPNDALANNNLGYQLAERNLQLDEAEKMIRKALEIQRLKKASDEDDDNAAYLDSLGWVLFRKGELEEAKKLLERASSLPQGADDGTVWDHLGDVYFKLKQTEKAKLAWETSLKLFQHDHRAKREGRLEEGKRKVKLAEELQK